MHAALLRGALLPPPAAGPLVGAGVDGSGARVAADRLVPFIIQGVARHAVLADVVPDLFLGPVRQRVDLDQATVVVVDLDLADVRARRPLVAAQAGDPAVELAEDAHQRTDLADVAAGEAQRDRLEE